MKAKSLIFNSLPGRGYLSRIYIVTQIGKAWTMNELIRQIQKMKFICQLNDRGLWEIHIPYPEKQYMILQSGKGWLLLSENEEQFYINDSMLLKFLKSLL